MAGTERDSAYHRLNHGIRTNGLAVVVTDLCLLGPHPISKELTVVSMHEGVMREQIAGATGWPVRFVDEVAQTPAPTESELRTLRNLQEATARSQG
jgi:glutaconate CoA-transferase subunit B